MPEPIHRDSYPASMLIRRLYILGKILLALIVLCLAFLLFERFRGQISLSRYREALVANGEKLPPHDLLVSVPDVDNGAPEILAAVPHLKEGAVLPKHIPPLMRRWRRWIVVSKNAHFAEPLEPERLRLAFARISRRNRRLSQKN